MTIAVKALGVSDVVGCDPFTGDAYAARVGAAPEAWSFADVANGCLGDAAYDMCVCCYALHLADASWMPSLLWELSRTCKVLLIISPHKRPAIPPNNGWEPADPPELRVDRVRVRCFWSTLLLPP